MATRQLAKFYLGLGPAHHPWNFGSLSKQEETVGRLSCSVHTMQTLEGISPIEGEPQFLCLEWITTKDNLPTLDIFASACTADDQLRQDLDSL